MAPYSTTSPVPESDWVEADPQARKQVLWAVAVCLVVGVICLISLKLLTGPVGVRLEELAQENPRKAAGIAALVVTSITAAVVIPTSILAGRFLQVAARIWRMGQFPPPGLKVAKATRIVRGRSARAVAVILVVLILALVGCCVQLIRIDARIVRCMAVRAGQYPPRAD